MNNSVNIQIIKNIHNVLSQSLNHFLTKSKNNQKNIIKNNFCTYRINNQLKENITKNTFNINENNVNPLVKSKTSNSSYSYFLVNNDKLNRNSIYSHYLKEQNNSYNVIRRNSNVTYLFDNYQYSDSIQSSRSNNSYMKIKASKNKRKIFKSIKSNSEESYKFQNNKNIKKKQAFIIYNNNKFNNIENNYKEFDDKKIKKTVNCSQKENINSKSSTSLSSINVKKKEKDELDKKYKYKNNNLNINNKNINKFLNENQNNKKFNFKKNFVLNNSSLKKEKQNNNKNEIGENNNINDINDNENNNKDINKNDNNDEKNNINKNIDINDNNKEDYDKKKEEKNITLVINKEEKDKQINILTKIKLDSVFGIGDYEIKNDNQDSLFIMTNNPSIRIYQNSINNYNYFFEENKNIKSNINKNNAITGTKIFTILGICDGHGDQGLTISNYISCIIPAKIKNILYSISNNKKQVPKEDLINELELNIKKIFSSINSKLNSMQIIDTSYSGSCFCSLLITKSLIISINLGNSKAIIGCMKKDEQEKNLNFFPYNLTDEHTPLIEKEKERIIENGGEVLYEKDEYGRNFGPLKIWKKNCLVPGLLTTRSFGDKEANIIGVISEPDIKYYKMKKEYKFIVVGSFGLWNYIDSKECVDIIGKFYLGNNIDGAVNEIMKIVKYRWIEEKEDIIEDISIIVGFFKEYEY